MNKIEKLPNKKEQFLVKVNQYEEMLSKCNKLAEISDNAN